MTIEEYAACSKLSYKQVYDRIQKGKLPAVKVGKRFHIKETSILPQAVGNAQKRPHPTQSTPQTQIDSDLTLKEQKLDWEIKRLQLQTREGRHDLIEAFKIEFKEHLLACFAPLKARLREAQLSPEQCEQIGKALDECLTSLKNL